MDGHFPSAAQVSLGRGRPPSESEDGSRNRMDGQSRSRVQTLRCLADSVETGARRAVREAMTEGNSLRRWRAQLLLELAHVLCGDLRRRMRTEGPPADAREMELALRVLEQLTCSNSPVPVA
jgi:hypothetical protein